MTVDCCLSKSIFIRYVDKLPDWILKYKQEGKTDAEIDVIIKGKTSKYVDKWGNKSKVGALINS